MFVSAIYNKTFGYFFGSGDANNTETAGEESTNENEEIVSLEYLRKKADSIINWAASINKEIFCEKKLRKYLTQLKLQNSDVEVLFAHMKHTGVMEREEFQIGASQVALIKLGNVSGPITEKEQAKFVLEQNIQTLEENLAKSVTRV